MDSFLNKLLPKTKSSAPQNNDFELILIDPKEDICEAWQIEFGKYSDVTIINGYFEQLPEYDCLVSAANSFGLMDGGIDLAITLFFGDQLQKRVQKHILSEFYGEQPVGTSFIIETKHPKFPFLAHTPTMRVPMPIWGTDNIYVAMAATLKAVANFNKMSEKKIKKVACCALGMGIGKVPPKQGAKQMALAYHNFKNVPKSLNWKHAHQIQEGVIYGGSYLE
jgi:O-acetyl-ADP-ribose deacetylase (regulator of RNase III)